MARKSTTKIRGLSPSYSDYRRLSPDENERDGFTRKARRYVLKSVRKLTKRTPTISARQHEKMRARQEYGLASPEIATKARAHGALGYKSGRYAEIAERGREKAYHKKLETRVREAAQTGARISEHSSSGAVRRGRSFRARAWHVGEVQDLRERKLAGEELSQGEFSMLMDYAETYKDPMRQVLRQSPGSFNPRITSDE